MSQAEGTALARLAKVAGKMLRGEFIEQYAAICIRRLPDPGGQVQILLITSRETGRWVIPKGWGMPKKNPHAARFANARSDAQPDKKAIIEYGAVVSATIIVGFYPRDRTCEQGLQLAKGVGFHAELSRFFHREVSHL